MAYNKWQAIITDNNLDLGNLHTYKCEYLSPEEGVCMCVWVCVQERMV